MKTLLIGLYFVILINCAESGTAFSRLFSMAKGMELCPFFMQAATSSGFKSLSNGDAVVFHSVFVVNLVSLSSQMSEKVLFPFQFC